MDNTHALPQWQAQHLRLRPRQAVGIGISLAAHGVLLALWQLARPVHLPDTAPHDAMVLRLLPAPSSSAAPAAQARHIAPALPAAVASVPAARGPASPRPADPAPIAQEAPAEQVAAEPAPAVASDAPALPPSGSMLERARAAAGGIDRGLRKEHPTRGIVAPVVTPQMKLERGLARANELAPNKWYEAPKTEHVLDPSHYGRKRYRVVGAAGTYCVTYESNHAPDGLDTMRDGIKPKFTTCDPDWEPPKIQKWN